MAPDPTSVSQLTELSPEEVAAYFRDEQPERIVRLIDSASDKEVEALVAKAHVREAAITHVLSRLGEFALPDRLADVKGIVQFVVHVPDGELERHALVFADGEVTAVEEASQAPDVSLELSALDFVRLVTGGVNAAILVLTDRLRIIGDDRLALTVGGVFQVPGKPGVAVDPAAVDPEEVARVLKGVDDGHLRRVMSGGVRDLVLEQVFTRLPDFLDERKAARHTLSIGFTITGRPDGGADRWTVHVEKGTCRVERGGEGREATITADGADFLKLVTGHLSPVRGVMRGHLKVRGDVQSALKLHKIMRIPGGR